MRAAGVPSGVSSMGGSCSRTSIVASSVLSESESDVGACGAGAGPPVGAAGCTAASLWGSSSADEDPPQSGRSGSAWPVGAGARAAAAVGAASAAGRRLRLRTARVVCWALRRVEPSLPRRGAGGASACVPSAGASSGGSVGGSAASVSSSAGPVVWSVCERRAFSRSGSARASERGPAAGAESLRPRAGCLEAVPECCSAVCDGAPGLPRRRVVAGPNPPRPPSRVPHRPRQGRVGSGGPWWGPPCVGGWP
jgi:hypothetical protein